MPGWRPHDSGDGKLRFKWYGKQRAYINVSAEQEHWEVSPIPEKVSPISDDYLDDLM
jgi:hypothetical protein